MRPPPRAAAHPQPTGGLVSANVADTAAAAIKRAGYQPTPGNVRMVIRAWKATGELPVTDFEWWDRLVRSMPLGLKAHVTRRDEDPRTIAARRRAGLRLTS